MVKTIRLSPKQARGNRDKTPIYQKSSAAGKTGNRTKTKKQLSEYEKLRSQRWKPRLLLPRNDPWIEREMRLGIQQIRTTAAFDPETGIPLNNNQQVLVWSKPNET